MKIPAKTVAIARMAHWKAGQGARIQAKRPPEVYAACEHTARQLAPVRDPLELTAEELATAVKAAISQERRKMNPGPLPKSADDWWTQISAIAERWGIKTTREDWTQKDTAKSLAQKEAA